MLWYIGPVLLYLMIWLTAPIRACRKLCTPVFLKEW
jgi:hypothetical protein